MNGNILTYLRSEAGRQSDKVALVRQIAQGMEYLHSREIIHGDLKVSCLGHIDKLWLTRLGHTPNVPPSPLSYYNIN